MDYDHPDDPAVRAAVGRFAGIIGLLCNFTLCFLKLLAGWLVGSVSILADALNNLSDAASSIITLLGFRLAQRPADADHPFGHARYEYLSGLGVAVLILLIGVELIQASVSKILNPEPIVITAYTLWILVLSILLKLWMSGFFRKLGKHIHSTALLATAVDARNDVIATGGVFAGCAVQRLWNVNIDGYAGLVVALFILYSGIQMMKETISPLLGKQADAELIQELTRILTGHDRILGIHDLLIHDYGPGRCFASVHAEISTDISAMDSHEIIDALEQQVRSKLNVNLVIHYDPVALNDPQWEQMREATSLVIQEIDSRLSMHDFRIARQLGKPSLVFHLEVPYEMDTDFESLKKRIEATLAEKGISLPVEVSFDRKE